MIQEKQNQNVAKVDYKLLSLIHCKDCNKPLKINQANKRFKFCYICFKINKGQKFINNNKRNDFGYIITVGKINLLEVQAQNIVKYRNNN